MLPVLISALAALGLALLRLWGCHRQMADMARVLEETPAESNLRLTVRMSGIAPRRLCQAVNRRLEEGRQLRLETSKREQELKYTKYCRDFSPCHRQFWLAILNTSAMGTASQISRFSMVIKLPAA